jgi:HK97 family phage major capsid protein
MDRITQIRARRAALVNEMDALLATAGENFTAETQTAFDALKAEDDKLAAEMGRLREVEARKAAAAMPLAPLPGPAPAASVPAAPEEKGLRFARTMRLLAAGGGNAFVAAQIAEAQGQSGLFANQNMSTGSAGGFLVPEDVSGEVIELLRPASVILQSNPIVMPMPNGNMTMNRQATGAAASYIGEQQNAPATAMSLGQVKLQAKKLAALIPISNDLLRSASVAADRVVRDDLVMSLATRQDLAFIRGSGTSFSPLGLRFQATGTDFATTNILTMTATPDLVKVTNDLGRLELAIENANVPMIRQTWLMAPRVRTYLQNLRDGNGNYAFPEVASGQLRGKPIRVTTQIPTNLGGGTESELYLVDFAQVVIGEHMGIEIAMSTEAAYVDATSTMQAAFSRDETVMRAIQQHDIGLRHLAAVAVLTGVTWGA